MCIKHSLNCWDPFPQQQHVTAEKERRVVRGLVPQGDHNWHIDYYLCGDNREPMRRPICPSHKVRDAPSPRPLVKEFCHSDDACFQRLQDFYGRYMQNLQAYQKAERDRRSYDIRKTCMNNLKLAWDEWFSAFDAHKRCQSSRARDQEYEMLIRWGLKERPRLIDDELRLQYNPNRVEEPDVSMVKH